MIQILRPQLSRTLRDCLRATCHPTFFPDPFDDEVELIPPRRTSALDDDYGDYEPEVGAPGGGSDGGFPIIIVRTSSGSGSSPFGGFGGGSGGGFPFPFPFPSILRGSRPRFDLDYDGEDEVEEVGGDSDDGGVVVSDDGGFFGGPGFNPFFGFLPSAPDADDEDDGMMESEDDEMAPAPSDCGLLCQILNSFQTQIKEVQEQIDEVRRRQQEKENEIIDEEEGEGGDDDGFDVNNSTYTEKVRITACFFQC